MNISEFDKRMAPLAGSESPMLWHEPHSGPFRMTGFPWHGKDAVYRRLPLRPSEELPDAVDALANCTAGGQVSFQTDSCRIAIQAQLAGRSNMCHMPATGQCGFDLYVGPPCIQRFHGVSKYEIAQSAYDLLLFEHPDTTMRNFTINFPLYQGVKQVQIGLAPEARITPPPPWAADGRIVIYGTSITQGGCASRPGMAYTNILSRALNTEIINLGFSGSGRGEPEVIRQVADVPNPRLFILDYEANSAGRLADTLPDAIRILRDRHHTVPVLVVSRIAFSTDLTHDERLRARDTSRDMQANLVDDLRKGGDSGIHFLDGSVFLGSDFDECTVDGIHPNDLGFMRIARQMEIGIRTVLDATPSSGPPPNPGDSR
ncbi:MAG: SGNH/GDSL hydrolase family protein [Opitutales bacterium]